MVRVVEEEEDERSRVFYRVDTLTPTLRSELQRARFGNTGYETNFAP